MKKLVSETPKGQSARPLWQMLQRIAPDVQCERRFDWLKLPLGDDLTGFAREIREALVADCARSDPTRRPKKQICTAEALALSLKKPPRPELEFDFYLPSHNVAIEFDERQHFTVERAVVLRLYTGLPATHFNATDWIARCDHIRAQDPDPPCRDWQRAWRDTMRDLLAAEHGIVLLRIAFNAQPNEARLKSLLDPPKA